MDRGYGKSGGVGKRGMAGTDHCGFSYMAACLRATQILRCVQNDRVEGSANDDFQVTRQFGITVGEHGQCSPPARADVQTDAPFP